MPGALWALLCCVYDSCVHCDYTYMPIVAVCTAVLSIYKLHSCQVYWDTPCTPQPVQCTVHTSGRPVHCRTPAHHSLIGSHARRTHTPQRAHIEPLASFTIAVHSHVPGKAARVMSMSMWVSWYLPFSVVRLIASISQAAVPASLAWRFPALCLWQTDSQLRRDYIFNTSDNCTLYSIYSSYCFYTIVHSFILPISPYR